MCPASAHCVMVKSAYVWQIPSRRGAPGLDHGLGRSPWMPRQRQLQERSWREATQTAYTLVHRVCFSLSPTRVSLACTPRILAHFSSRAPCLTTICLLIVDLLGSSDTLSLCRIRCMIIVGHSVGDWLSRRGARRAPALCPHIKSPRFLIITSLFIVRSVYKRPVNPHCSFAPETK
jgi:hypothetical protein